MTKLRIYAGLILSMLNCVALLGQSTGEVAPGAPGNDAHWPGAAKVGFGTSNHSRSKVWFTLTDGVMTEVYYPRLECRTRSACSDCLHQNWLPDRSR